MYLYLQIWLNWISTCSVAKSTVIIVTRTFQLCHLMGCLILELCLTRVRKTNHIHSEIKNRSKRAASTVHSNAQRAIRRWHKGTVMRARAVVRGLYVYETESRKSRLLKKRPLSTKRIAYKNQNNGSYLETSIYKHIRKLSTINSNDYTNLVKVALAKTLKKWKLTMVKPEPVWCNSWWIIVTRLCWAFFFICQFDANNKKKTAISNQSLCFRILPQTVTIFNYQTSHLLSCFSEKELTQCAHRKLCCLLHPSLGWLISLSHSPAVTYGG